MPLHTIGLEQGRNTLPELASRAHAGQPSLLTRHGKLSQQEPGCARFEAYHSENDPRVFILNERWESEDALNVHRTAEGYTTIYVPQVLPLVDRTPHRSQPIV